jgi:hypothetical protein
MWVMKEDKRPHHERTCTINQHPARASLTARRPGGPLVAQVGSGVSEFIKISGDRVLDQPPTIGPNKGDAPAKNPYLEHLYRPDIDGLRAVAVATVIAYHTGIPGFRCGLVGVDIFFVISGYLISGLLLLDSEKYGHVRLVQFYARRVR